LDPLSKQKKSKLTKRVSLNPIKEEKKVKKTKKSNESKMKPNQGNKSKLENDSIECIIPSESSDMEEDEERKIESKEIEIEKNQANSHQYLEPDPQKSSQKSEEKSNLPDIIKELNKPPTIISYTSQHHSASAKKSIEVFRSNQEKNQSAKMSEKNSASSKGFSLAKRTKILEGVKKYGEKLLSKTQYRRNPKEIDIVRSYIKDTSDSCSEGTEKVIKIEKI